MNHHHSLAHQKAVHRTANARAAARSQLEKVVAQAASMWEPQVGPVLHEQLEQASVVRKYFDRPTLDLGKDLRVVVLD
jgi:hypothetical protein